MKTQLTEAQIREQWLYYVAKRIQAESLVVKHRKLQKFAYEGSELINAPERVADVARLLHAKYFGEEGLETVAILERARAASIAKENGAKPKSPYNVHEMMRKKYFGKGGPDES